MLRLAWYIRPIRFEILFERKKNDSQVRCLVNSAVGRNYDKNHYVNKPIKRLMRWDRGDLVSYYSYTGYLLSSIFYELLNIQKDSFNGCNQVLAYDIYDRTVTALNVSAQSYIPS